jgi:hypothetical protein
MKILLIDIAGEEGVKNEMLDNSNFNTNLLKNFAEPQDIRKEYSFDKALNFIISFLISEKKFIDFILIYVKSSEANKANDFARIIRENKETYFHGYFNLSAICLVIMTEYTFHDNVIENELYTRIIYSYHEESHLILELGKAIDEWRQKLAGELDELNLKPKINFKDFSSDWALRHKLHKLNILTAKFITDQQQFSFIWLGDNLSLIDYSVNEFQQLIKSNGRFKEKQIHQYLKQHERFLLGEYKSHFSYEKQLYYHDSRKYIEIDFVNHAYPYLSDNPEAFEIKRPEKELMQKNKKGFYSHFNQYLNQVHKYYQYLSSEENRRQIESKLNIKYQPFDYTMLFSRREFVEEYTDLIDTQTKTLPFQLNLITYDELIDRFERFYYRTKKYGVR